MSKYDFSRISKLIRRYHNLQINRERKNDDTKVSRKNIYKELLIKDSDTAQLIILKILFFWISNGNIERITNSVLAPPIHWSIKPGSSIPQLVVIYRIKGNNKTGNYSFHIPHYNGARKPIFPTYVKGKEMTTLILKDGSSMVINASSEAEGERVINQARRYISSKFLTTDIRHSKNNLVKRNEMVPVRADYFPNGQEDVEPLWRHYF